jgi:hypothetical protein
MPNPTMSVLAIDTIPEGMLRRAALGLENPKPDISVAEYDVITPLEMAIWVKGVSHKRGR